MKIPQARLFRASLAATLLAAILYPALSEAQPTTTRQAKRTVQNWLDLDSQPLKAGLGSTIQEITTYLDANQDPSYHIVSLAPQGFVIVAGDDAVEPIIGFAPAGEFTPSLDNPLGALVLQDIPSRVQHARDMEKQASTQKGQEFSAKAATQSARKKWEILDRDATASAQEFGLPSISDMRVSPLLQTLWNQTTESNGSQCYNIYTPNHYPCGCVATAFAQIMRFWQFPTTGVGTSSFTIWVDGGSQSHSLLGGDDVGGAYSWSLMDVGPAISDASHRQAIGRLTHDAGISVNMSYTGTGSGADTLEIADSIKSVFGYSSAKKGYNSGSNLETTTRNAMVNPNLDAGHPVAFGITGTYGGHAIVGDGYGFNSGTLYHHLNMGWGGSQNAWYNLPTVDDDYYGFTSVYKCVYNISTSGTGEIISGRVTDASGNPVGGVTVTATRTGGGTYSATSNAKGIYALTQVPSSSTYQISATGYPSQTTTTGTSTDYGAVGNKWGVDFSHETFTLTIASTGAPEVAITASPATYSGITTFSKTDIASGTAITLTAPATSGSMALTSWNGCDSSTGATCEITMHDDTTVTASYTAPITSLGQAVDNTDLVWTSGGDATWSDQSSVFHFDGDAAQSGAIADAQTSSIQTIVTGPGELRFYWKVSSEEGWDYLSFFIDGAEQTESISGEVDWALMTYSIPAGSHMLTWSFQKDCCELDGDDTAWLDKVEWAQAVPTLTLNVNSSGATGVPISSSTGHAGTTDYTTVVTSGSAVTLTAPETSGGAHFTTWAGCTLTGGTTCNVTVDTEKTVIANYAESHSRFSWSMFVPAITGGNK